MSNKPMSGTWTLIAPDGRLWSGESPADVYGQEQSSRDSSDKQFLGALQSLRNSGYMAFKITSNDD